MSHSKKRTTTTLIHRHVRIDDRPTSLALEPEFWQYLREIAYARRVTQGRLFSVVNQHKGKGVGAPSSRDRAWARQWIRFGSSPPGAKPLGPSDARVNLP